MFLGKDIASFFNNLHRYYLSLADDEKLIIYIILILVLILIILFIIMKEQKKVNKKIADKKIEDFENLEVLDLNNLDIDETNEKTRNLKEITEKIQSVIDNRAINLTKFEEEQEKNSVISYKELVKTIGKDDVLPKEDITFSDKVYQNMVAEEIEREEPYREPQKEGKFKSSIFISPVFGAQDGNGETIKMPKVEVNEKEETYKKDRLGEEEAFLNRLINFRKNLE